jgi:transcriptional regulator with XRE-family HTH domain
MRESARVTMRTAGGLIGISHVAISQFENGKLKLPGYRIEQLIHAYGFSKEEFQEILGKRPALNLTDDCHAMIDRLSEEQLAALHSVLVLLFRVQRATHVANHRNGGR